MAKERSTIPRRPNARALRAKQARESSPRSSGYGVNEDAFMAELQQARSNVDTLRTRIIDANIVGQDEQFGVRALHELDGAHEELRTVEEELHAQAKEILATRELLDDERRRYRELFNTAPEAYLVTDEEGVVREANRRAGVLLNIDPSFLVHKPLRTFVELADRDRFTSLLRRLAQRAFRGELRLRPRHGDAITVQVSAQLALAAQGRGGAIRWMMQPVRSREADASEVRDLKARVAVLEHDKVELEAALHTAGAERDALAAELESKSAALS